MKIIALTAEDLTKHPICDKCSDSMSTPATCRFELNPDTRVFRCDKHAALESYRYRMDDGTIIDTANATMRWAERGDWDGSNMIGRSSNSQWRDQWLYRSRKGRYYIEYNSRVQGERDHAEWISPQEAVRWLLLNEYAIPDELNSHIDQVSE